jgi:hypothetical protein
MASPTSLTAPIQFHFSNTEVRYLDKTTIHPEATIERKDREGVFVYDHVRTPAEIQKVMSVFEGVYLNADMEILNVKTPSNQLVDIAVYINGKLIDTEKLVNLQKPLRIESGSINGQPLNNFIAQKDPLQALHD